MYRNLYYKLLIQEIRIHKCTVDFAFVKPISSKQSNLLFTNSIRIQLSKTFSRLNLDANVQFHGSAFSFPGIEIITAGADVHVVIFEKYGGKKSSSNRCGLEMPFVSRR